MARRSVALNGLEEKIDIVQGDIREAAGLFPAASFDVVTCNPPYMAGGHGLTNPEAPKAIARHEVKCTFEDVAAQGGRAPEAGGQFFPCAQTLPPCGDYGNPDQVISWSPNGCVWFTLLRTRNPIWSCWKRTGEGEAG